MTLFREGASAVARREGEELVFAPAAGGGFALSGDASILDHPDALARTWAALANPNAGEVLVSAAEGSSSPTSAAATTSAAARTARSSWATRRCRCSRSASRARQPASSTSRRSSSRTSASPHPRTRSIAPPEPLPSPDVIEPPATTSGEGASGRMRVAFARRSNWEQLAKFCVVGVSGYLVNLGVFAFLQVVVGVHYIPAAIGSFLVAVANNYAWNRLWTFRGERGHVAYQGLRFLVVSTVALVANLVVLYVLVKAGVGALPAQAIAIVARDAAQLRRQQALVLPPVRRWACAVALALLLASRCERRRQHRQAGDAARARHEHRRAAVRSRHGRGTAAGERGPRPVPRLPEGRALARALPAEAADRRDLRQGDAALDGQGVVGPRGRDRAGDGRGRRRPGLAGADRPAGRVEHGARPGRAPSAARC